MEGQEAVTTAQKLPVRHDGGKNTNLKVMIAKKQDWQKFNAHVRPIGKRY